MDTIKFFLFLTITLFVMMCVPPADSGKDPAISKKRLDSLRNLRCPRLMSSAAEYYRNRDWKQTVKIYKEITTLDCDEWNPIYAPPQEIYQYYAIAFEQMGKFDSAEFVLLDGLQKIPENIELRKRLAYSYKKQGKFSNQIIEYERLVEMDPKNVSVMNDLSKIYKEYERYDDQIVILQKILAIEANNEIAQSELAVAFENSGKDPLEVYRKRYEDNLGNMSYGIDFADRLREADRAEDAAPVLEEVIKQDPSSKIAHRKLAEAYIFIDNLDLAAKAYEELFKIDPRDFRVAINISDVYLDNGDFRQAIKWADKATDIDSKSADALGQKGKVYYYGWDSFRQNPFTNDDRLVAKLAYNYFIKAENRGYKGFSKSIWLKENEKDVLYGKAQWFMADDKVKRNRKISTLSSDYSWVTESLDAEEGWK